jgi:hypothetical protein
MIVCRYEVTTIAIRTQTTIAIGTRTPSAAAPIPACRSRTTRISSVAGSRRDRVQEHRGAIFFVRRWWCSSALERGRRG